MVYTLRFFSSSKCSLFHKSNVFVSCIIHILYTECAKIKKNNSGAKRLILSSLLYSSVLNMYELSTKLQVTTTLKKITYLCTYDLIYIVYNGCFQ